MNAATEGADIRRRREDAGWSAKAFCQEICVTAELLGEQIPGIDPATVSRFENGKRSVSARYRRLIDATFRRTLACDETASEMRDAMHRRDFLAQAAASGAGLFMPAHLFGVVDTVAQLASALIVPQWPDEGLARVMEATTGQLSAMFITTPGAALSPLVEAHLGNLANLLGDSGTTGDVRATLASAAAETAVLAGWLAHDSDNDTGAERRYLAAVNAAEVADDRAIAAYAIASAATALPAWRRTSADTVELLSTGNVRGFRAQDASPSTRAWVESLLAEALVRGGRNVEALNALDRSGTLIDRGDDGDPRPRAVFFNGERLQAERALIAQRAGAHNEAVLSLGQAITDHEGQKISARYLLSRARSYVALGDVDGAAADAVTAARLALQFDFAADLRYVRAIRAELPDSAAIDELDAILAA